jgi:lipopolysaccharide biosynthesis protein
VAGLYDASTASQVSLREVLPQVSLLAPRRSWRLVRKSRRTPHNPSELVWWRLLEAGVPYVKIGLFRVNHYGIDLGRVVAALGRTTPYDLGLIHRHLARCG